MKGDDDLNFKDVSSEGPTTLSIKRTKIKKYKYYQTIYKEH